jgi:REP element-mobilizing transposase RayT
MARKREWYPGASYHVTARGNHRNDIFKDKEYFLYFLTLMNETVDYYIYDKKTDIIRFTTNFCCSRLCRTSA